MHRPPSMMESIDCGHTYSKGMEVVVKLKKKGMKKKGVIVGGVVTGVAVAVAVTVLVRFLKKRAKSVIKRKTRRMMIDVLKMRGEDFIPGGKLGMSVFRNRIDKLEYDQLVALYAIVEVGYFIKASIINPQHPSKAQVEEAAKKYLAKERTAPSTRAALLEKLDTSDAHDAIAAAFNVLVSR